MTPRALFQTRKADVSRHADLADDSFVNNTLEIALSEMVWTQQDVPMPEACRQNDRIEGAKRFVEIWRNLSKKTVAAYAKDEGALEPEQE